MPEQPDSPYRMTLDLSVLNHLGMHLYGNQPAVLSEVVTNAWDADAAKVSIVFNDDHIEIADDGCGMTIDDANRKYLTVGYSKRAKEGDKTPGGRAIMGRKGIGKLSLFSIAKIVEIHSKKKDQSPHAFLLDTDEIEKAIKDGGKYLPQPIDMPLSPNNQGTKILLKKLKLTISYNQIKPLRARIARRFSVIGEGSFQVKVGDAPITMEDRDDINRVEYLWKIGGDAKIDIKRCPTDSKKYDLIPDLSDIGDGRQLLGWIGSVDTPKSLKPEPGTNLNSLVLMARGRLVHEDILPYIGGGQLYTKYLTGQIHADFLDDSTLDDIATSDRQKVFENDGRFQAVSVAVGKLLRTIESQWTRLRNEDGGKKALKESAVLKEWVDGFRYEETKKNAIRVLDKIWSLKVDDPQERLDICRHGMLAFERLELKSEGHKLADAIDKGVTVLLPLLTSLEDFEGALYRDIVKARLEVIEALIKNVDTNVLEKVLQEHLFKNLWLLDPMWERASSDQRIERDFKKELSKSEVAKHDLKTGRADITYKTSAGSHLIVELKRVSVEAKVSELVEQAKKYRECLAVVLSKQGDSNPKIKVMFVLGNQVNEEKKPGVPDNYFDDQLRSIDAEIKYYEKLILGAKNAYEHYLTVADRVDKLDAILERLSKELGG